MDWLQVIDYPEYFINEEMQVMRNGRVFAQGRQVVLRAKDKPCYSIGRPRLLYLTKNGFSPLSAKGKNVDIFMRNGVWHIEDRSTRRAQMAKEMHSQPKRTAETAIALLNENIRRCQAMIKAINGDSTDFLYNLNQLRPRLKRHIAKKFAIRQKDVVEDVVDEALLWYINAVTVQHTTASSFEYISKRAEGVYKDWLRQFTPKRKELS